ncbi:holo-ACP synthase [Natranaerobius trueperi]|uniref:Holo-[acyl-carrier-protein] synthase n=1 Tax=Natranaerobius trueperi TaxID=759412 RepID=A0A226BUX7_9FIRM|nr:holo-ACP synthase [Natranaerobius trueperi]OWZ82806.1 holo-[acyl-carrier-protein] synthase [Natranaerobius trueperi]
MIIGIGIDVIELKRIQLAYQRRPEKFSLRILSKNEKKTLNEKSNIYSFLAGRFAAKEAIGKALGTGLGKVNWKDIDIWSDCHGKPQVNLYGYALEYSKELHISAIYLSISHSKETAVANAILWK